MVIGQPWVNAVRGLLIISIALALPTMSIAIVPCFKKNCYIIAIGLIVAAVIEGTVYASI